MHSLAEFGPTPEIQKCSLTRRDKQPETSAVDTIINCASGQVHAPPQSQLSIQDSDNSDNAETSTVTDTVVDDLVSHDAELYTNLELFASPTVAAAPARQLINQLPAATSHAKDAHEHAVAICLVITT